MRKAIITGLIMLLILVTAIYAHQPVIVKKENSKDKPIMVENPLISYAFYGELDEKPHYYKLISEKPFNLYVNILVPDYSPKAEPIKNHDVSFEILKDDR